MASGRRHSRQASLAPKCLLPGLNADFDDLTGTYGSRRVFGEGGVDGCLLGVAPQA